MTTGYRDQERTCAECGREFVWRAEAQQTARPTGAPPPKLCRSCRTKQARDRERGPGGGRAA